MGGRLCLSLLMFLATSASSWAQSQPASRPATDLTGPWQLFVDDALVAARSNVVRKYHPFEKSPGNPILLGDQPWEGGNIYLYGTVLPGPDGKGYRMWYQTIPGRDESTEILYAVSQDGLRWVKPALGVHDRRGSTANNIVSPGEPQGFMASVIFTPWVVDARRRYAMMSLGRDGWEAAVSPDGIRFRSLPNNPVCKGGSDSAQFLWDPNTRQYVGFGKVVYHVDGMRRRCIGRSATRDISSWPPFELVLAPDTFDDRWADGVHRTHLYGMSAFAYETMYIGLLWVFRATDEEGYLVGPVFVELATSRDGLHWQRQEGDRPPILPLGKPGSWDDGMIYTPTHPLVEGNMIRLYYSGFDEEHGRPMHGRIGLATLRKDGFASFDASDREGTILTKRLAGTSGPLRINASALGGHLKVEVLDADGRTLPGYGLDDGEPLTGDAVDHIFAWETRRELPSGQSPVRLRFTIRNASVYSFAAGDAVRVLDEPAGPPLAALYTFEDDWGRKGTDKLTEDGSQDLAFVGGARVNDDPRQAAFGRHAMGLGSEFTPLSTMEIRGTAVLGRHFTLAAMVKATSPDLFRVFSSHGGCGPVRSNTLVFEADPGGRLVPGLRLTCQGIGTVSRPVTFADGKYHHLAAVYDDGLIALYLDGAEVGRGRVPGGSPVRMQHNLFVAGDAAIGTAAQFTGQFDDVLVLGRSLSRTDIEALASKGAEAFFAAAEVPDGK